MKRYFTKIIPALLLALIVFVATTHQAHALGFLDALSLSPLDGFNFLLAALFNGGMKVMGLLLAIAGATLNFSISLTLNIKDFVDKAPAIYTTWKAIRDISGIFFIFFLLYSAIQLILGLKGPKYGDTLKNIVVAGVLINFSFFFAGLGIDASNIVSKQIYNAIAPDNAMTGGPTTVGGPISVDSILGAGGISNIFMNSLEIQTIYSSTNTLKTNSTVGEDGVISAIKDPFKIVLMGAVGIIIEFVAAISFFAAALAFIGRFVILLFLLAFSPIWFLSFLSPEIKTYTESWQSTYKSMLFMPIYLLLMDLALNVLTTTPMFGKYNTPAVGATSGTTAPPAGASMIENALAQTTPPANSGDDWYKGYLLLAVNATIVIFLLNMPLVAAASIAGKGSKVLGGFMDGAVKKFGAGTVWKGFGNQAGTRTLGRAAYALGNSGAVASLASKSPLLGGLAVGGLSKVSQAGFGSGKKGGYEDRLKAKNKAREDLHKKIGTIDETQYDNTVPNEEGKTELDLAKEDRKKIQENYRENLPWRSVFTGKPGGMIGFMVDNRANRQAAGKLSKEASKQTKKEAKKKAEDENKKDRQRLKEIVKEEQFHRDPMTTIMSSPQKLKDLADERNKILERIDSRNEIIEQGKQVEDEEKDKKIMDKLETLEKKGESGGGGEKPKQEKTT
ncbi:MAG: hypothetical protein NT077_03435 [Candidatus Taylorbacteria bacterium]|nr:hypothetical protein [Candidatus Taylorbacteria bacterium]